MRRRVAMGAAALLVLGACDGGGKQPAPQSPNTVVLQGQVANDHGSTAVAASGDRVVIAAGDFYFQPTVVTGAGGQEVVVAFTSASETRHNISILDGNVDRDVPGGQTVEVELTFPPAGRTLVFVCKYHRNRGMAGALVAA